jgi:hypothetical protein
MGEDDKITNDVSNWREELLRRYKQENEFLTELHVCNTDITNQSRNNQHHHHNQLISKIQYLNQNQNYQTQHQIQYQNHNTNNYNQKNHQQEQDHYVQQHHGEREDADGEKYDENEIQWSESVKRWINR